MADTMDKAIDAALARGEEMLNTQQRARSVRYDQEADRVIVDLVNDCTFMFPPRYVQGLQSATVEDLSDLMILRAGFVISWERADVQISIQGLMDGIFGTKKFMQAELARKAGSATSPAKAGAARSNGAKGGRPPRAA
jgi:hypothetical protein